jgi:glucose-6-phosphate-specific signal transduction histidine kinase
MSRARARLLLLLALPLVVLAAGYGLAGHLANRLPNSIWFAIPFAAVLWTAVLLFDRWLRKKGLK